MVRLKEKAIVLYLPAVLFLGCDSARILGLADSNSKSHFDMFEALLKSLAARGHEVVFLNHFPQKILVPYTAIDVSDSCTKLEGNMTVDFARTLDSALHGLYVMCKFYLESCRKMTEHPNVRHLLNSNQSFDLVITEIFLCECSVVFAHMFRAPLVSIDTSPSFPWTHGRVGNTDHPAYVANYFLPYASKMIFPQRVFNTAFNVMVKSWHYLLSILPTSALLKDVFGEGTPTVGEMYTNTSLVLVNSHFSIAESRPTVPNYIEVGGLHIKQPKPLPQDIKKFMDESEHGVVYFSLGSLIQAQSFPPQKLSALMGAFAALPERVLMKYTGDDSQEKPDNVMAVKWLPQHDILRHPNVKAFISHGGQLSIQESVHAGVPVVGLPIFGDQTLNIVRLVEKGMAIQLSYEELTKDSLLQAIRTVIDNRRYSENARRVSALFRDRPMSPMDTAVYWVEYVIRHRGAPHLRSAGADMPLYQYLLLDVITVLLLVLVGSVWVACCAVKVMLRLLPGGKVVLRLLCAVKVMLRLLCGDKVMLRLLPGGKVMLRLLRAVKVMLRLLPGGKVMLRLLPGGKVMLRLLPGGKVMLRLLPGGKVMLRLLPGGKDTTPHHKLKGQ